MSRLDILPAQSAIDFNFALPSTVADPSVPRSFTQNYTWGPEKPADPIDIEEEHVFPGLPALQHGHPDVHLRKGVINALSLAAEGEPDAEQAFFVADLGQVYMQHQKWRRHLPEIEPFFGEFQNENKTDIFSQLVQL